MQQHKTAQGLVEHLAERSQQIAPTVLVASLVCAPFLIFVLPLLGKTPPVHTISTSLLADFNNSVSILCAAALSILVLICSFLMHRGKTQPFAAPTAWPRLSSRLIATVLAFDALVLGFAGWAVTVAHQRYLSDAGYIIEQATVHALTGRSLYTQIEFAYGPLLVLPVNWVSHLLGCSITASYFIVLVLQSAIGLLMLAFVLNELPIPDNLRRWTFILLAIAAVTPHLGLNYTLFRFTSPLVVLLLANRTRSPWTCAAVLAIGEAFELATSPELGFTLAAGVCVFGIVRAWQRGAAWLACVAVPVGVFATLLLTFGQPFLRATKMFSRGGLSLPVGPYPHILLFLFALIWLVPFALGRGLTLHDDHTACYLALYAASASFLPAALGRCDSLHVLFNGTGILVLALLAFGNSSPRARQAWIVCLAVVVLLGHRVNDRIFKYRDATTLQRAVLQRTPRGFQMAVVHLVAHSNPYLAYLLSPEAPPDRTLDVATLRALVNGQPVATPMEISPTVERQLIDAHLFNPGFFAYWVNTSNPGTEQRIVDYTDGFQWLLMPAAWQGGIIQVPSDSGFFQGLNLHYHQRVPMLYCPGMMFRRNLEDNWTAVWGSGDYILYKHTGNTPLPPDADLYTLGARACSLRED